MVHKTYKKSDGKMENKLKREISTSSGGIWEVTDASNVTPSKLLKLSAWNEENLQKSSVDSETISTTDKIHLNNHILRDSKKLCESWQQNQNLKTSSIEFINDPFKIGIVNEFVDDKEDTVLKGLVEDMEKVEWTRKQMDLYEFFQTDDLANIKAPHLSKFYDFLTNDFKKCMENLTGIKFRHVSASCSMYNSSDHLLVHDDLLSDRMIAYVFYISPWAKTWNEKMGGALEIYKTDENGLPRYPVHKKIPPKNNQLTFFKVCKKSFHSVEEVFSLDFPRLTINGWLHGFSDNPDFDPNLKLQNIEKPIFKLANPKIKVDIKDYITEDYLKDDVKKYIQKEIEEKSEIALEEFFESDLFDNIWNELKSDILKWQVKNPANLQHYEILKLQSVDNPLSSFLNFFSSQEIFKYLYEITELDLYGKKSKHPKFTIEIQRWRGGCYSLIGDTSTFNDSSLDLVLYFGNNENVGKITYLNPEEQHDESDVGSDTDTEPDAVLLTIYPKPNVLNIVYRSEGTTKFTKYTSKKTVMESDSEYNYLLLCSYKE